MILTSANYVILCLFSEQGGIHCHSAESATPESRTFSREAGHGFRGRAAHFYPTAASHAHPRFPASKTPRNINNPAPTPT
jgi:hypothetical protein